MRILSVCIMLTALFAIAGCANPYKTFYKPIDYGIAETDFITCPEPNILRSTGDMQDVWNLYSKGYGLIGESSFNSAEASDNQLFSQAKKVHACIVLVSKKFTHMDNGYMPVSQYHPGSTSYIGNTQVQGPGYTTTKYIPYQESRFDFKALYFSKVPPTILGVFRENIPDELRIKYNIEKGEIVRAVREGHPAEKAGFIPGDIIIGYGGAGFVSDADFQKYIVENQEKEAEFTIRRGDKELKKVVVLGKKPQ